MAPRHTLTKGDVMKKFIVFLAVLLLSAHVFAGLAYVEKQRIDDLLAGGIPVKAATITGDATVGDDLTVTDDAVIGGDATVSGAVNVTGALEAGTIGISEGYFDVVNSTNLVFIASGVTNVIDVDITTE